VGIVHQELAYCPNLSIAEGLCLARLPHRGLRLDRAAMRREAQRLLALVGADCDPDEELGRLPTAYIQLVQIAAAVAVGGKILVMDEPTSSLSTAETERLYEVIARLRAHGTTILYVSHRMEEIFRVCDTVTVLRDGQHVETRPLRGTSENDLVRMMIGREVAQYFPVHTTHSPGPECLRAESLSSPGKFNDVSFSLHAGEVLGMAGLVGAGRSEVVTSLFGLDPAATGRIFVDRQEVTIRTPQQAMRLGLGLVGEDRKRQGIVPEMSCRQNATLAALDCPGARGFWGRLFRCPWCPRGGECLRLWELVRSVQERKWVGDFFERLRVRAASPDAPIATLSGGNQQKLVLSKWLIRKSRILILDEPTRGVDVGAKAEIHHLIDELAAAGHAILMISSELPEILHLSSRIIVFREGRLVGQLSRHEATQEKLMQLMAGVQG
jgi:ABC-type sugar transport system ATPase subunit